MWVIRLKDEFYTGIPPMWSKSLKEAFTFKNKEIAVNLLRYFKFSHVLFDSVVENYEAADHAYKLGINRVYHS